MARDFPNDSWALILGGSSGFGLPTAQKLAQHGMNFPFVHRDWRRAMNNIDPAFEDLRCVDPSLIALITRSSRAQHGDELRI